jgi:multiple sugar transport system ATP-binding protein
VAARSIQVAELRLEDLHVRYPDAVEDALAGIDLVLPDGARLVLAGASGSGKTTLLRAVGGLAPVTGGRVLLDGRDVTHLAPGARDVVFAPQEAALQPHLDVRRNLGTPLRWRGVPADEEDRRVVAEARAWRLTQLLPRRPRTLATGERQEVALAKSLVRRGNVLLLDEPLARVDAHRRTTLRRELLGVQSGYGVTTVLTSNDPVTAHAFGELVAVLDRGRVVQVGPPAEVAAAPATSIVAELLAIPPLNLLSGWVERTDAGPCEVRAGPLRIRTAGLPEGPVTVGVSPRDVTLGGAGTPVTVLRRVLLGPAIELTVVGPDGAPLRVHAHRDAPAEGATIHVSALPRHVHLFDAVTGAALVHGR